MIPGAQWKEWTTVYHSLNIRLTKLKKKKRTINTGHFTPICNTAMCGVTTGKNIDGKLFLSLTLQQGKKYGHFSIKVVFIFNDITFGKLMI